MCLDFHLRYPGFLSGSRVDRRSSHRGLVSDQQKISVNLFIANHWIWGVSSCFGLFFWPYPKSWFSKIIRKKWRHFQDAIQADPRCFEEVWKTFEGQNWVMSCFFPLETFFVVSWLAHGKRSQAELDGQLFRSRRRGNLTLEAGDSSIYIDIDQFKSDESFARRVCVTCNGNFLKCLGCFWLQLNQRKPWKKERTPRSVRCHQVSHGGDFCLQCGHSAVDVADHQHALWQHCCDPITVSRKSFGRIPSIIPQ